MAARIATSDRAAPIVASTHRRPCALARPGALANFGKSFSAYSSCEMGRIERIWSCKRSTSRASLELEFNLLL